MSFLVDEKGRKRFDNRVEIVDPKTGKILKYQPYRLFCKKGADPEQWYERDGIKYALNGDLLPGQKLPEALKKAEVKVSRDEKGLI